MDDRNLLILDSLLLDEMADSLLMLCTQVHLLLGVYGFKFLICFVSWSVLNEFRCIFLSSVPSMRLDCLLCTLIHISLLACESKL
jgi:hypothetical protein